MSKFFRLTKKQNSKRIFPKGFSKTVKINFRIFNATLISLIIVIGVASLVQINSLAVKGYQIKDLQNRINELKEVGENLQLDALKLQSMDNIKNKVSSLDMVAVGEVSYLTPTPVALATR